MKNLFIPYELAVIAKEKRFNEECFAFYAFTSTNFFYCKNLDLGGAMKNTDLSLSVAAPLYQQIVDWLREKHNIHFIIRKYMTGGVNSGNWHIAIDDLSKRRNVLELEDKADHRDYYEALNTAIEEAFKLI